MNKLCLLYLLLLLLGCPFQSLSQSNIDISHYSKDYGANYRWVYDITQDDRGFIWFANHTGLRRYDGENFVTYQHNPLDTASINSNTLIKISFDHQGFIWAYGMDGVFNRLEIATGKIVRIKPNFSTQYKDSRVRHFGTLSNGEFIALYSEQGTNSLWKHDPETNTLQKAMDLSEVDGSLEYFSERSDGKLWLWDMDMHYFLADLSQNSIEHILPDVTEPELGIFYYPSLSKNDSILSFKLPGKMTVDEMERISLDNLGNIWFYNSESEVYRYNTATKTLDNYVDPIFRKSRQIQLMYHFFEDADGGIWNGHFFGAIRFNKRQNLFRTFLPVDEQSGTAKSFDTSEILSLSPERLIVSEDNSNLYIIDLATNEIKRLPSAIDESSQNKSIYSIVLGTDGYLWSNQANRIIKTDIGTGMQEIYNVPLSPLAKDTNIDPLVKYWPRLFEDASGTLWWCAPDKLSIFDKSTKELLPSSVSILPQSVNADFKFAEYDPQTNQIYGSYEKGIFAIDCESRQVSLYEVFTPNEGYDLLITSILFWNDEFWLSTNKGLMRYHPQTRKRKIFTRKDGLPSNVVNSTVGSEKYLWLGTQNGLCQLDPYKNQIANYYEKHGLPSNIFNIGAFTGHIDGRLFFGGEKGIVGFHPERLNMSGNNKGHLNLIELSKYNQREDKLIRMQYLPNSVQERLIVDADERTIALKYAHTFFGKEFESTYSHFLEGLEKEWVDDKNQNEIRYSEIPPGEYIFRARAIGPNNLAALNEISIPLLVKQYWYFRWWAILFYTGVFFAVVYGVYKTALKRKLDKQEAKRIKELDEVKTTMYTNITHEFRTPLTVILGMNDAMKEYAINGEIEKVYEANTMIDRNGQNLLKLINQMLDLSKLEAGILDVNNLQGNIIEYLKYRLESFQSYGEAKGVKILFHSSQPEIIMDFDVDKISHILGNLVSNAIKYTPEGGLINVYANHLTYESNAGFLEIKIVDTGIGIEESQLGQIFDRFYQIDGSSIRKGEGTGIGLSLIKQLITLLRGKIEVKSEINVGSEFRVILPITRNAAMADEQPVEYTSDEWSEGIAISAKTSFEFSDSKDKLPLVLVVEDNEDVAHYIRASINDKYRTAWAKNGIEGINLSLESIPDVIISDIMMPEQNGYQLCEILKNDQRTSHIPIILLTGKADTESMLEGIEYGADVYLSKPFNRKELLIRLRNLMTLRSEIQNHYRGTDFSLPINGLSTGENSFILKVRQHILDHLHDENFSVTTLCELVHISRPQLHRKLVAITGESTTNLIRKVKMEKAKELLSLGELNVSEVAYQVGFKTQAHFSRVFSEAEGMTPSKFSKR